MPLGVTTQIGAISSDLIVRLNYQQTSQCFRCGSSSHRVKDYTISLSSSKRVTIAAINNNNSGSYNNSNNSDSVAIERPGLD
jgi:hypothetical protein